MKKIIRKKKESNKKSSGKKKRINSSLILSIIIFGATLLLVTAIGLGVYIIFSAPEFSPTNLYEKESTILLDKNSNVFANLGVNTDEGSTEKRQKVTYDDLPQVLVDAIISTEDSRFFQHNGFDLPRFIKASAGQLLGRDSGGASTLTMQVSKNSFTSLDASGIRGIIRKFTDIYMSIFKIEKHYTKENIIEFYVNAPFLGSGAFGVQQASKVYFGKDVNDLSLTEAAIIAGLFQAPTHYDPYTNPKITTQRRATVLYLMKKHGYITEEEEKNANAIPVEKLLASESKNAFLNKYQGFVDTVIQEVKDKTGNDPYDVPMIIYTTLDPSKQDVVDNVTNNYKFYDDKVQFASVVSDNNSGAILAVGAGRHKNREMGLNYATGIKRQIGSTAKPLFDYGPGFEYEKWSTYTPFFDEPTVTYSDGGKITNFDNRYNGITSLHKCLANSKNTCAVEAFQRNDNAKINSFVSSLGIVTDANGGRLHEAHALGSFSGASPLQMAAAYAAIGNGGYYIKPYSFTKIEYRDTKDEYKTEIVKNKVMSKQTAYLLSYILRDVTPSSAKVYGSDISTKTGTSNYSAKALAGVGLSNRAGVIQDSWIISFSPEYTISSWNGYDELTNKNYLTMNPADVQRRGIMGFLAQGIFSKNLKLTMPSGIVSSKVELETIPAMKPSEFTPGNLIETHLFILGSEPADVSQRFSKLSNPINLSAKKSNSKLTITWNNPGSPAAINNDYLQKYFADNYKPFSEVYLSRRQSFNSSNIGSYGFDVYLKNATSLKYVGSTNDNSFIVDLSNYSEVYTKVVVKSSYSIFKANASDGSEYTFSDGSDVVPTNIVVSLPANISLVKDEVWNGSNKDDLKVTVNNKDVVVTNSSVVVHSIKNSSSKDTAINDITKVPDTYTINYNISFIYAGSSVSKSFKQTVIVK
ncbi:MAG: transglycosylase domain-containing protein [Bacilli bacterium]